MQLQLVTEIIPAPTSQKKFSETNEMLTLADLCNDLSISIATGRNWIKLGKLIPSSKKGTTLLFKREYISNLKKDIKTGKNAALKSRRNKKYVSGTNVYHSYISRSSVNLFIVQSILNEIEQNQIAINSDILTALISECALQLIFSDIPVKNSSIYLSNYIERKLPDNPLIFLIDDILQNCSNIPQILKEYPTLFNYRYVYEKNEDILGLLYISLSNITTRKSTGSYYTPTVIVKKLCQNLFEKNKAANKNVLDPCCGTGNFILQLPDEIKASSVYGNDIDPTSVKIARINYALKYKVSNPVLIYEHITEGDYLLFDPNRNYDFIIGNPPWGYDFSEEQKIYLRHKYTTAIGSNIESYDVFIEQALLHLKKDGILSFILPEAILNVKAHMPIRKMLFNISSIQYIEFLGNAFDKIQCPCIILQIQYTGKPLDVIGTEINDGSRKYYIQKSRWMDASCFSFTSTDEEYTVLEKISSMNHKITLEGNARFALGIVTGNNKKYISQTYTDNNEMVLKGSDIYKYNFKQSNNYITFKPETFQQIAPVCYYRAKEKLLYRFICNQLVFAYDNNQTLSLNSCNIVIPEIKNLNIKYIMAVLNSQAAQFYFKKHFNSVKVLRSHIEQIPIPLAGNDDQTEIINIVDDILASTDSDSITKNYEKIDIAISRLYGLSDQERSIIRQSLDGDNLFLP
ncbi:MAG: N-6 DNA methylase [Lachnospiraceae bacterium]|nr:N-6 DNA methylase [Lachnospiraceae bacterium]